MDFQIKDKIALVTAASRGLGRGCAEQLAAEKCRLGICSRNADEIKHAAEEISAATGTEAVAQTYNGMPINNAAKSCSP